jgi:hypothetical protein
MVAEGEPFLVPLTGPMTAGHDPVHLVKHSPERRRGSLKFRLYSGSGPCGAHR